MRDYFRRLGLPASADLREIRRAYRELARRCRPVAGDPGAAERLASLHRAYEVLSDPGRTSADAPSRSRGRGVRCESAFADEVDIDFPSMSALVDRMRSSFFGPLPDPVAAEVRLTPRQATDGVRVPVDVSLLHTCPICGGRGEIWLAPCGACAGSGAGRLPHQLQLVVPPGVRDGTCLWFVVEPAYASPTQVQVRISIQ
jgi:DnaJ-class molecular chaperone